MTFHSAIGRSLDIADVNHFWKFGYVKLRGFLYDHELDDLRDAMDDALSTYEASPNFYNVTAIGDSIWGNAEEIDAASSTQHDVNALGNFMRESGYPRLLDKPKNSVPRGRFLVDTSVWRREPRLASIALEGSIPAAAATLLGVNRTRFFDDQLFVKEGGAVDKAAFHQDLSYFHLDGEMGCVAWIPLDSVRRGGGCMGYVPGSHRWGKTYNPNVFVSEMPSPGSASDNMPSIDSDPEKYNVRYIEADPGDVVIHHFQTIHGSEGNTTGRMRRAFSLRYCDADIRYRIRPGAPFQPMHRQDSVDGDPLDNDIHPIVWSAL
jgi:hypothetical protein